MKKVTILLLAAISTSLSVSARPSVMCFRKCDSKSNLSNASVEPTHVTFSKAHAFYENPGSAAFAKTLPAALLATNLHHTKTSLKF